MCAQNRLHCATSLVVPAGGGFLGRRLSIGRSLVPTLPSQGTRIERLASGGRAHSCFLHAAEDRERVDPVTPSSLVTLAGDHPGGTVPD